MGDWTFFSNHGHVMVCLARNHEARLRDVAVDVGITERAVQKIVKDLQDAGFLTVSKQGRCNRYRISKRRSLRHGLESHCTVGKLLALVSKPVKAAEKTAKSVQAPPDEAVTAARAEPLAMEKPPVAAPVPPPVPAPAPAPVAEPAKVAKKPARKKKEKAVGPVDVRQQGNLF